MKTSTKISAVAVLLICSLSSTGCKSSGRKSLFSWNREPSATTLAGGSDLTVPESPAKKYTPNAIASVGAGTPNSGTKVNNNGTNPATSIPSTSGLAAAANGYKTGPYDLSNNPSSTTTTATAGSTKNQLANGLPNPYGGTYSGVTPNSTSTRNSLVSSSTPTASTAYPTSSMPNALVGSAGGTASLPANSPNANGVTVGSSNLSASTTTTYPALPSVALPSVALPSVALPSVALPSGSVTPPPPSAYGSAAPRVGVTASAPATSQAYQPGTTSRATTYNFGGSQAATSPAVSPPANLPPNTAAGAGPGISSPINVPVYR